MEELKAGQRAVGVNSVGGQCQRAGIGVGPDVGGDRGHLIGVTGHRRVLHAHSAPAALGLDRPERRLRPWLAAAET